MTSMPDLNVFLLRKIGSMDFYANSKILNVVDN